MSIDRRNFIKLTAAVGAATAFASACSSAAKPDSKGDSQKAGSASSAMLTTDDVRAQLAAHLDKRGFTSIKPAPLITGHAFNGGLQYDDDMTTMRPASYVFQQAARVEDPAQRRVAGTLPLFTILALETRSDASEEKCVSVMMNYLLGEAGLDPKRLYVTTTDRASHLFPELASFGISIDRIRIRSWEEAQASGSGSGFFRPAGHPRAPSFESFSLEYKISDGTELEIVECLHEMGRHPVNFAIGVERLTMARNDRAMMWSDALPAFKKAVEDDAKARGLPLPIGYYDILGLPHAKA